MGLDRDISWSYSSAVYFTWKKNMKNEFLKLHPLYTYSIERTKNITLKLTISETNVFKTVDT